MATTYLSRTISAGSTGKIWTFSAWVKRAVDDAHSNICNLTNDAGSTTYSEIAIKSAGELDIQIRNTTSTTYLRRRTSRLFRDCNGWYNIIVRFDSTESSAGDRLRIYVNGVQETSMQESVGTVDADYATVLNTSGATFTIGRVNAGSGHYWNGCMSHIHFADGQSLAPTVFGETDATTGEWKIKTSPTFTVGTNGFTILKDGNTITDQSSNSNDFTLGAGTLTNTEDCPSNVFATFNPLDVNDGTVTTFSNGNTTTMHNAGGNGATNAARSTLGYSKGKFYWESKCVATGGDVRTGIISMSSTDYNTEANPYTLNEAYNYKNNGDKGSSGNTNVAYGATYTAGDIIGIAHDVSAGTLTFYKNGATQGTAFTGLSTSITWGAFTTEYNQGKYEHNFGNGYFGTSAIASEGTNASGIGKFEYDVPTGFTALSTKGLNA